LTAHLTALGFEAEKRRYEKVFNLHYTEVFCGAKGKEYKPYEFGNKISFAYK